MITAGERAATAAISELDQFAEAALTHIEGDPDEQQATAKWHVAGFMDANNVSMMGGWT